MAAAGTGKFEGKKLRKLRTDRGWSQSQLGHKIGAHVTSVSDWERGDNAPSGRHIVGLARELGVPVEHFYGDDEDEESDQAMSREQLHAIQRAWRFLNDTLGGAAA